MLRSAKSILTVFVLLAALMAISATPVPAQTSGRLNLECMSLKWQVQGDNVLVKVILDKVKKGELTLSADNPIQQVDYKQGDCGLNGTLKLWSKKEWGQGKLDMNVTITQGGNTYGHQGTVATW
ncbi:MAG: hypothetical protein K9K66_14280 [Desulfarculaceae bacterium]|nr:hypothetical protein [Desulfarculaceae bacterium]MCF8073840.1 hypothetical protein [Desulfarculaceae bacterium]MCF8102820.1 hypothetical protein [Desulfarculaceae bacterium]MCF8116264.1 hypothetical protein [Desulfarculaceae bacterium]